ncbi:MAG: hypothetical protein Q9195_008687 [Heterodermia aff. obscurata]
MDLLAQAETAQDVAAGLNRFLDPVPEYSTEITALISECFAISSALRELQTAIGDSRYNSQESPDPDEFDDLHFRISNLLEVQQSRLVDDVNNLSLGSPAAARVRSFERRRPQGIRPPTPPSPDSGPAPRRRHGPHSPLSPGFDQEFRWNPPVPDVPNSPITTNTSSTSQSSRASFAISHWVSRMYEQSRPTTGFCNIGQVSVCLGEDSPNASSRLAEDYEKLTEIFEHLILFHCTFLALKAEDLANHLRGTVDDELHGEKVFFGGLIIDDHYEHALRVFRDRDSGCIRMQASVRSGDLKRTPVWTAFITHLINSRTWKWRDSHSPKTVYLADLQRYIFTEEYSPQLGPDGEHELRFTTSEYALDFMDAIDKLASPSK